MLLNWFLSSISEESHLKHSLSCQDLKTLGVQYCTHLLAAGVLRQISDKDAPNENIFKPNLMYYWSHMELPASQPVTPGKLDMSSWPPERDTGPLIKNNQVSNLSNTENDEISDLVKAKIVITDLKRKLHDLENQLENYKINAQFSLINNKLQSSLISAPGNLSCNDKNDKIDLVSKEVQTCNGNENSRLANKPVINTSNDDNHVRTNVNMDTTLGLSRLGYKHDLIDKDIERKTESRSEKIENYCKLNKSRDSNKSHWKDDLSEHIVNDNKLTNRGTEILCMNLKNYNQLMKYSEEPNVVCESSSDASFLSTTAELLSEKSNKSSEIFGQDKNVKNITNSIISSASAQVLFIKNDIKAFAGATSQSSCELPTSQQLTSEIDALKLSEIESNLTTSGDDHHSRNNLCQPMTPPPPLPGMSPAPPPMPGTKSSITPVEKKYSVQVSNSSTNNCSQHSTVTSKIESQSSIEPQSPSMGDLFKTVQELVIEPAVVVSMQEKKDHSSCAKSDDKPLTSISTNNVSLTSFESSQSLRLGMGSSPPSMPDIHPPSTTPPPLSTAPSPPSMPDIELSQAPMSSTAPPPPPMPNIGPSPPPMPDTVSPLPPLKGMGPPPPPMPEMGPPPPPMPEMGPTPPSMPCMGPPPPPMPEMGPTPPPMPGMGPPPPLMPGMGPPPPPMPGMGPPPPPMPGMPPPPPMCGALPPPPPMAGLGPPPPPIPGVPAPPLIAAGHAGPVPFPAPPVGGWNMQRATLRKTPIKPAAPMKPLYWTRILAAPLPPTCQGEAVTSGVKPLWLEIDEAKLDNIDEFTDLFSRQVVKAPAKKKVEVKTKIQPIKILDSKRSQNVGILAQSLHVEFSEIENAIYNFDTSVVSLEALQQIYELRATKEELMLIKEHLISKPDIPLDKPEAFLHDLSGIHNFAERISCFTFQAEFDDAVNTIMHKLDNLKHTCEFLITNESLKQLFSIILAVGNYMNGGNGQRGQADGFGLEILSKLKDVKSKQSNVTLLHFIVRTYMKSRGGALSSACALPVPEPGDVFRAATIDFADVEANLATLRTNLDECRGKMETVIEADALQNADENAGGESNKRLEVFKDKMTTFLNAAEEKLKTENENLCECRNKFIATVKFYQYSPKNGKIDDCEPKEFFSLWTSFCTDFKDIYKKEEQIAIKEKLKETKKLQCERRANTQPKKEGGLKARLQKLSSSRK